MQTTEFAAFPTWHPPCIVVLGSFCPPEANLSSHLSISYSAATPASGTTAATAGTAAAAGKQPAADGPLGFLAALVDQLLAGGGAKPADGTSADGSDPAIPQLASVGLGAQTVVSAKTSPQANVLLTKLAEQLKALKDQLDKGQPVDPDALQKLGETADALAALITTPAVQPATAPTAPMTLDPLKTLKTVGANGQDKAQSDIPGTGSDKATSNEPSDQVKQFLAGLGITLPTAGAPVVAPTGDAPDINVAAATPTRSLPAIAQLAAQLSDLSQAIAPAAPEVAQKLETLTQKLQGAETDPNVLAQLAGGTDPDATALDQIVQSLMTAKQSSPVPTAPQLAATTPLQIPAPVAPQTPKAPTVDALATASDTKVAASSAPTIKLQPVDKPSTDTPRDDSPKSDAKIIAAATAQADSKAANSTDNSATAAANSAVAPAAATSARAIPAAYQTATNPINMTQVAFEMVRQMHQGQSRFSIRIDPPELGRVDVKMHVDASGNVNARLTVERSETLDMFQRDKGSLEKALGQAGLDGAKTNLEFSLKQNPFAGMTGGDQRQSGGNANGSRFSMVSDEADDSLGAVPSVTLYRGTASSGGINLFV